MKKLLFISPDYYGFQEVIYDGFVRYSDHKVTLVITNEKYKYKNFAEKIQNSFSKLFLKKNLKKIKQQQLLNNNILINDFYDIVFVNRPDMLTLETYNLINRICKKKITYYWDSFEKIKSQEETIQFFDICYSFEKSDCKKYNLQENHNFYFETTTAKKSNFDLFFLGTFDSRFDVLQDILSKIKAQSITYKCILYTNKNANELQTKYQDIEFINKPINFKLSAQASKNANIILDIQHQNQEGLSFRPFEAMGLRKKLITTNKNIVNFDFYNPNNIFVWDENCTSLPDQFLQSEYKQIDKNIFDKYSLENWVKKIII